MADDTQSGERTEAPSAKRLEDARQKSDVARSRELDTAVMLTAGVGSLAFFGPDAAHEITAAAAHTFDMDRAVVFDPHMMLALLQDAILSTLLVLAPFLLVMFVAALAGPLFMGGFTFSVSALRVDPSRLNPVKGIARLFSMRSAGELVKSILKVVLFGVVATLVFTFMLDDYLALGRAPLGVALGAAFKLVFGMVAALAFIMLGIAMADVPWQKFQHLKKLRMTLEDVKREQKESNGNPEVKSRIRSEQMKVSQRRMLRDVASASVVITNPTHYAVALRYREGDRAPIVVAKGVDELALRIRAIAGDAGVRMFEAPPLARAVYRHTRVGETVRPELWHAIAQVLAFVMQLERGLGATRRVDANQRRNRPVPPSGADLAVPRSLSDDDVSVD